MQHFELKGEIRQVGNKATIKAFRKQGLVPCNLYGAGIENVLFTVDAKALKALTNTPKSYIVDLELGKKKYTAILHELQFHPVEDTCLHVDFLAVGDKKPVAIDVPLVIKGTSKGALLGGKFTQSSRSLRISAMLDKLPDDLTVDVSDLELDKRIKAGDLKFDGITILSDKDTIICSVRSTRNTAAAAPAEA